MKRRYRLKIVAEATFERKASVSVRRAKAGALRALRASLGPEWALAGSLSSTAKPARPPPPKPTTRQLAIDAQLAVLRGILADMALILGNVKRPRLHLSPNRWCGDRPTGAHAHSKGPNRGLICISPKEVLRTIPRAPGFPPRTTPDWLMSHELTHIRMPGGSHNRAAFKREVDYLMAHYRAMKAGTWSPPKRIPGWAKPKASIPDERITSDTESMVTNYDGTNQTD